MNKITLTSAPGDSVELLIVMKLYWYCEDITTTPETTTNKTSTSSTQTITTTPGFELIVMFLSLAAVGIVFKRRN